MGYFALGFAIVTLATVVWNVIYDYRHTYDPGYIRAGSVNVSDGHRRWWLTDYMTWVGTVLPQTSRRRWFLFGNIGFWIFILVLYLTYIGFRVIGWVLFGTAGFIAQMVWLMYWPQVVRHGRRKAARQLAREQAKFESIDSHLKNMGVETKTNITGS